MQISYYTIRRELEETIVDDVVMITTRVRIFTKVRKKIVVEEVDIFHDQRWELSLNIIRNFLKKQRISRFELI